jgi:hypothetical protein
MLCLVAGTSVPPRTTRRNILEDGILLSQGRENLKSYAALTGWAQYRRHNVFPVWHELGFYTLEDGILHGHRREHLKSYAALTCRTLKLRRNVSPVRYELWFLYPRRRHSS